jgi:hypothetical protein
MDFLAVGFRDQIPSPRPSSREFAGEGVEALGWFMADDWPEVSLISLFDIA